MAISEPLGFFSPADHDFGERKNHESNNKQQET
jgi:hypothetical protein